ncbi:MAG: hypothetical protein HYR56_16300 [Acidobacteria bacterium]|nr:hypothetical protein [Acidobacteriota bacterium]MBI3424572.1 hypothetical protein [Acidobacteriota bacterium]
MEGFFKYADKIIQAASQSPLGIVALTILVIAVIGIIFFRKDGVRVRVSIFVLLLVGLGLLVWAVLGTERSSRKEESKASPIPVNSPLSIPTETPAPLLKQTPSARLIPRGIKRLLDESKSTPTPPPTSKSITNSPIISSPGSVQNTGDNVTINQTPPARSFTPTQRQRLLQRLRQWPPINFHLSAVQGDKEANSFALQIKSLLEEVGWTQKSFGQFIPGGSSPIGVLIIARDQASAPKAGAALQEELTALGVESPGSLDAGMPDNTIRIIVGHRPN